MVNLIEREDVEIRRPVFDARYRSRSRNWGARFGRRREEMKGREPVTLHDLESLTDRAVEVMERHVPKSESNHSMVMDLLRVQYNLNFKIICQDISCTKIHEVDDLIAPER